MNKTPEELEAENKKLLEEDEKKLKEDPNYAKSAEDIENDQAAKAEAEKKKLDDEAQAKKIADEEAKKKADEEAKAKADAKAKEEADKKKAEDEANKDKPDYKAKFAASTREGQRLFKDNLEVGEAYKQAGEIKDATDDELQAEYPNFEDMSDTEKRLAKENLINKKKWTIVESAQAKVRDSGEWFKKIDDFTEDPRTLIDNPELEGKIEEFKAFAGNKDKVQPGTDLKLTVNAFLHEQSKIVKPKNKGQMFETGNGGPGGREAKPDDKISLAQAEIIKQTNYREFVRLNNAGKIATE